MGDDDTDDDGTLSDRATDIPAAGDASSTPAKSTMVGGCVATAV